MAHNYRKLKRTMLLVFFACFAVATQAQSITVGNYNTTTSVEPFCPAYTQSEGFLLYTASQLSELPSGAALTGLTFKGLAFDPLMTPALVYASNTDETQLKDSIEQPDTASMVHCFDGIATFNQVGYAGVGDSAWAETKVIYGEGDVVTFDFTTPIIWDGHSNLKFYFRLQNPLLCWTACYLEADKNITHQAIARYDDYRSDVAEYKSGPQPLAVLKYKDPTAISSVTASKTATTNAPAYNLAGQRVSSSYRGIVIENGKKYLRR